MSENRDKGKGAEDKEGKRLEDRKAQQEAEMEKTKDASKGGISSSSTPLKETATDTKSGSLIKGIPSSMLEKMLEKPTGEITKSELGRPGKEILQTQPVDNLIEYVRTEEFREENLLFEKELTRDVANYSMWLTFPPHLEGRFPFPGYRIYHVERLCFTDAVNKDWWVTLQFQNGTYRVMSGWVGGGWGGFRNEYKLEEGDVIKFYKAVWPRSSQHFLIQHVTRDEATRTGTKNDGCILKISGMKKHGRGGGQEQHWRLPSGMRG